MAPASPAEAGKRSAAEAAAELAEDGMTLGLGTGTTVAYLLPALARRRLDVRCVATSPATERAARELGLVVEPFDTVDHLDLAVDGADQVAPDWWLIKGGGAAHTREKIVAAAAGRFVVIVDDSKVVPALRPPVPLELVPFGVASTLRRLRERHDVVLRDVPPSPDGGLIADLCDAFAAPAELPAELSAELSAAAGVVEHGLFPPDMVSAVVVGRDGTAEWLPRPGEDP